MSIRGFDPSRVSREHIRPKTLVFGSDRPGIELRLDRFSEILEGAGEAPSVYKTAADAIGYISAGDMFSDSICVVVHDISDMLGSDAASKRLYSSFINALSTYDDSSTIVMGAVSKGATAGLKRLLSDVEGMGGLVREVAAPGNGDVIRWIDEYSSSIGLSLSDAARSRLVSVADGDIEKVPAIVEVIGQELEHMTEDEIRVWLEDEQERPGSEVRRAIEEGDVQAIAAMRTAFPPTSAGYRTFLLRVRYNLTDLVIASAAMGDPAPLTSFKASQYANGNGNAAYYIMREKVGEGFLPGYLDLYREVNSQIEALSAGVGAEPSMTELLAKVPRPSPHPAAE